MQKAGTRFKIGGPRTMKTSLILVSVVLSSLMGVASAQSDAAPAPQTGNQQDATREPRRRPDVMGTITAINGQTLTIKNFDGHDVAVTVTDSTRFMKDRQPAKLADFKVGDAAMVRGRSTGTDAWEAEILGSRGGGRRSRRIQPGRLCAGFREEIHRWRDQVDRWYAFNHRSHGWRNPDDRSRRKHLVQERRRKHYPGRLQGGRSRLRTGRSQRRDFCGFQADDWRHAPHARRPRRQPRPRSEIMREEAEAALHLSHQRARAKLVAAFAGCSAGTCILDSDLGPDCPAVTSGSNAAGSIQGVVKSGNTPIPGATVTASNTLTGRK